MSIRYEMMTKGEPWKQGSFFSAPGMSQFLLGTELVPGTIKGVTAWLLMEHGFFMRGCGGFVALAYYLGGRQILKCNLAEAL